MITPNKEIAAAIGFAGNRRKLAEVVGANANTISAHARRGYFSPEIAKSASVAFDLSYEKLVAPRASANVGQSAA